MQIRENRIQSPDGYLTAGIIGSFSGEERGIKWILSPINQASRHPVVLR